MIELKTEPGSHRRGQLHGYFELGRHYNPDKSLDLTYLTGPLTKPPPGLGEAMRYAHVEWSQALPLVQGVWGDRYERPARRGGAHVRSGKSRKPLV